jgi:hypothetical protein
MEYRFEYYDSLGVIRKNNQLIVIIHIVFLYHCGELLHQSVHDPTLWLYPSNPSFYLIWIKDLCEILSSHYIYGQSNRSYSAILATLQITLYALGV